MHTYMKTIFMVLGMTLAITLLISLPGCSKDVPAPQAVPRQRFSAPPYHQNTVQNFTLARIYMSRGRYELAREHLLLALSSARDETMRSQLAFELEAVEKMIATRR